MRRVQSGLLFVAVALAAIAGAAAGCERAPGRGAEGAASAPQGSVGGSNVTTREQQLIENLKRADPSQVGRLAAAIAEESRVETRAAARLWQGPDAELADKAQAL